MTSCPQDESVDDFVTGRLPPARRREVEVHVDSCASCRQLVARLMRSSPSSPHPDAGVAPTAPPGPRLAIDEGVKVDRYIILGSVGAGGMGTVYAAYDRALDRKIALKFLARARSDQTALEQMLAEASAMAKLTHPNVVTVHDVGAYEGKPYLAMEFVEGTTLDVWRRQQPRTMRDIARVMAQVARGLAAAHAAGIIHRDVKPQNVLVAGPRVLVTDFGLSVREQSDTLGKTLGTIAGTPAYMAPEQFRGDRVDARTDVFGFCATLFDLIHGCPPFGGTAAEEVRERQSSGRTPLPPAGSKAAPWLHRLALRGLAVDPKDRPSSMDALADELLADPAAARRRRAIIALAVGAAAAAFVVGWRLNASPELRCRAGSQAMDATWSDGLRGQLRQHYLATGASSSWPAVEGRFDDYSQRWRAMYGETCAATYGERRQSEAVLDLRMDCLYEQRATVSATARSLLTANLAQLTKSTTARLPVVAECEAAGRGGVKPLPPEPQVRDRIRGIEDRLGQADAKVTLGDLDAAGRLLQQALADARKIGYEPLLSRALHRTATVETLKGRGGGPGAGDRAVALLLEAIAAAEMGRDDLRRSNAMNYLVASNVFRDRHAEAEAWVPLANALLTRMGDPPPQRATLDLSVGWLRFFTGKRDQAEAAFDRSLALRRTMLSARDPLVLQSANGSCTAKATLDQQNDCFRALVKDAEITFGPRHPDLGSYYNNLAIGLVKRPRTLDEGCVMIRKAVQIKEGTLDPAHPTLLDDVHNLAWCLNQQGNQKEARVLFERGLAHAKPQTAAHARMMSGYGLMLSHDGDGDGAGRTLRDAVAEWRALFAATHHEVLSTTVELGEALLAHGHIPEALREVEGAIAACRAAKVETARLVELHNVRGKALHGLGQDAAALAAHQEALRLHDELSARPGGAPVGNRPPEVAQAQALHGLGVAALGLSRVEAALEHLERALSLSKPGDVPPELRAETAWTLARALLVARKPAAHTRACALGQEAVAGFHAAGSRAREDHRRAQSWLQQQGCLAS